MRVTTSKPENPHLGRFLLTRAALVAFGMLLTILALIVIEATLSLLDIGSSRRHDPFVGFSNLAPMFERTRLPGGEEVYRTSPARNVKHPAYFSVEKPADAYRAFVVGGSSAHGIPYGYAHAFSARLQDQLRAAHPDRQIEVVNAALSGYSTRRIVSVVEELANYEPDLLIIYSGHNELAESRYYRHLLEMDPRLFAIRERFYATRIYSTLSQLLKYDRTEPARIEFKEQASAMQMFAAVGERLQGSQLPSENELTYRGIHYRSNLERMARTMHEAGAEVMLLTLSQDFADWPPGTSTNSPGLSPDDRERFDVTLERGRVLAKSDCAAAIPVLLEAIAIDSSFAMAHFEVADCYRKAGSPEAAREHYMLASDLDRVPLGANTDYNAIIEEVARRHETLFVDVYSLLEAKSPDGLVGRNFFVDFVHPDLRAHQLISEASFQSMRSAGLVAEHDAWQSTETVALDEPDDSLRAAEDLMRAVACGLTRRWDCARGELTKILEVDPTNAQAAQLLDQVESESPSH